MMRLMLSGTALAMVAACATSVPNDVAVSGSARDAALSGAVIEAPSQVAEAPLAAPGGDPALRPLPSSVTAAVTGVPDASEDEAARRAAALNSGVAPLEASPSNPPPTIVNDVGISNEQDFEAVLARRSIGDDAELIAQNRAQYAVVTPTELPTRPGSNQPNIVEYALRTNNPVGTAMYRRSGLRSQQRATSACRKFPSPDQAQIEFLSTGGPERDRRGLDPDGDGYACNWNPRPFRTARGAAPVADQPILDDQQSAEAAAPAEASAVVEPLVISSE